MNLNNFISENSKLKDSLCKFATSEWRALAVIFLFAFFLRAWAVESVPPGFYCDEASNGYNAYSILLTGKDEHGTFMPLYFRAFGEYKNPVFIYSAVPFIGIFGLSVFSVRLVSAFYGALTIFAAFLLTKKLFGKKHAFIVSFLLAISPWHLIASRIGFELITLPFYFILGIYFLLKARDKMVFSLAAALSLSLAVYSYGIAYIFVPFFLFGFFVIYFPQIKKEWKKYSVFFSLFLLFVSPLFVEYFTSSPHIQAVRERGVSYSIFDKGFIQGYAEENSVSVPEAQASLYFSNYLSYYSPEFLFLQGGNNLRHTVPGKGNLYFFMLPFIVLGVVLCFFKRKRENMLVLFWLFSFPVVASAGCDCCHAFRTINAFPIFEILAALAIVFIFARMKKERKDLRKKAIAFVLVLFALMGAFEFLSFENHYFFKYPAESYDWFQYGLEESFAFTEEHRGEYNKIYFSPSLSKWYDQPYIMLAFFAKSPPSNLEKDSGKYVFIGGDLPEFETNSLLVSRPGEIPVDGRKVLEIAAPDGKKAIEIREID